MIDPSITEWLPDDPELKNFYKGINDFVEKHSSLHLAKRYSKRKVIIDPCVGYIELQPWEITILDLHIFQQLRKITQLGLAYLVFPTLRYSRFEHTLGVVGRLDQMLRKLRDKHKDEHDIQILIDEHETKLRLAALFHDLGHCLFSHLSESVISKLIGNETADKNSPEYYPSVETIKEKFKNKFRTGLSIAEIFSITMMASTVITETLHFGNIKQKIVGNELSSIDKENIPKILHAAANFIAGIPLYNQPKTVFLAQLISSGLDADKLDYMSREEHFSGIKVEMDLDRILNKIKIQKVNTKRGLQKGLEKFAKHIDDSPEEYYVLCIERGGQFAYEEFCVARLALYEKVYLHKKVRAAEQSLKNKLEKIPEEISEFQKAHNWLYLPESIVENETKIYYQKNEQIKICTGVTLFGEEFKTETQTTAESKVLSIDLSFIEKREVPHRAFAFGPANATYDSDYYSLLDSAKTKEDIDKEIQRLLSVKFWEKLKEPNNITPFVQKLKDEILQITDYLISGSIKVNSHTTEDLIEFKKRIEKHEIDKNLIIDVPDYQRVVLSFETLHFEESSFQLVRWTIPIHRISHYYQLHRILAYVYYDKKYCDIICLACEKVTLGFIGSREGQRQVYEQKTHISADIYNSSLRLKDAIIKKVPEFYTEYKELLPTKKSLKDEHTTDVINKIVQEVNRFHFNKYNSTITHQDVINFLRQFPEEIQNFVLEIVSCIKVLHEAELDVILKEVFENSKLKNPDDKLNMAPLGTTFSSAFGMMKHFIPLLTEYAVSNDTIEAEGISNYNHLIFYDDNTNSGRQALNIIARWCGIEEGELKDAKAYTNVQKYRDAKFISPALATKLKDANTKITLCFITGTTDAENFLKKHLKKLCGIEGVIDIKIRYYMKPEFALFSDSNLSEDNNIFSNIKDDFLLIKDSTKPPIVKQTKKFLFDLGKQLVKGKEIYLEQNEEPEKHALGYCNRESTVIFSHSIPTSTITALWCSGKYKEKEKETEIEKEWKPLIPRDKK